MCEFHGSNGNGFGYVVDRQRFYFSSRPTDYCFAKWNSGVDCDCCVSLDVA